MRDQTRLSCKFGANRFSGSGNIFYTNKKVRQRQNRILRSALHAAMTLKVIGNGAIQELVYVRLGLSAIVSASDPAPGALPLDPTGAKPSNPLPYNI